MPILLSIVWMEVGRRARFPVEGIGMPGRFLVRIGGAIAWRDEYLSAADEDQVLERVLQNLLGSFKRCGDEAAETYAELLERFPDTNAAVAAAAKLSDDAAASPMLN